MRLLSWHPEQGLDEAEYLELSLAERARIDAHLETCLACRLHRRAREDFEHDARATQTDEERARALARGAIALLRGAEGAAEAPLTPALEQVHRGRTAGGRWRRGLALAGVLLGCGGAAAAATGAISLGDMLPSHTLAAHDQPAEPPRGLSPGSAGLTRPVLTPPVRPPTAPTPTPTNLPADEAEPGNRRELASAAETRAAPADSMRGPASPPAMADPSVPAEPTVAGPAATSTEPTAQHLFTAASRARRQGELESALRIYGELQRRFPGTREEIAARVITGQIHLERGQAANALANFERYLVVAPAGALAEEARVGRALALRRLSRPDHERSAWLSLLQAHPQSLHANKARERLQELGTGADRAP